MAGATVATGSWIGAAFVGGMSGASAAVADQAGRIGVGMLYGESFEEAFDSNASVTEIAIGTGLGMAGGVVAKSLTSKGPQVQSLFESDGIPNPALMIQNQNNIALSNKDVIAPNSAPSGMTPKLRGMNNPNTRAAAELGNRVHYDQLNGSTGLELPTELSQRYPETQFRFSQRGQAGPDVEVIGGAHPSQYPGSNWQPSANFADFKPNTPSGARSFNRSIKKGKLPPNTQMLQYNPQTGRLQ